MSDPSAIQLPIHQALTSDMMLGLKPSAPKSRSYRISVPPMNGSTFKEMNQMIFELPTGRRGTWLDQSQSYLKFSVQVLGPAAAVAANVATCGVYCENTAYSFFQRLDIYNSSNLLETINEYGQLANFLIDTSLTQSDKAGLSTMIGSNNILNINTPITAGQLAGAANIAPVGIEVQRPGDRSGQGLAAGANAGGFAGCIPYTFCLPVMSGVVGCLSSKMLPVGKLNAPIRCEFYTSANDDAIYYGLGAAAGVTWQICNAEFVVCYVELQDDSLDIPLAPGEQEYISTTTYRQASTILPAGSTGEITQLIPIRCASLTALYCRFRPYVSNAQGVQATCAYRKSCSINPNLNSFYFRIGSSMYPNKPIYLLNGSNVGTGSEAFAELLKSFHALTSTSGNTTLSYQQYNVIQTVNGTTQGWALAAPLNINSAVAVGTHFNAFAIGLELQSFSNRSDSILSGISTLNSQVYFTGTIGTAVAVQTTIEFFSQLDMILVLSDGILSAKF